MKKDTLRSFLDPGGSGRNELHLVRSMQRSETEMRRVSGEMRSYANKRVLATLPNSLSIEREGERSEHRDRISLSSLTKTVYRTAQPAEVLRESRTRSRSSPTEPLRIAKCLSERKRQRNERVRCAPWSEQTVRSTLRPLSHCVRPSFRLAHRRLGAQRGG